MISIFISATVRSEQIDEALSNAEEFFNDQTIINATALTRPGDLIGSLVYYKEGNEQAWEFVKIVPKEILETIDPIQNNKIILQTMASHNTVVEAKYLTFFKAKIKQENLLQVILEDLYDLEAPSFLSNPEVRALVDKWGKALIKAGYEVFYVDRVNVTSLSSKIFEEGEQTAGFNFYVEGSGSNYRSTEKFKEKVLISLHRNRINDFIEKSMAQQSTETLTMSPVKGEDYVPSLSRGNFTFPINK